MEKWGQRLDEFSCKLQIHSDNDYLLCRHKTFWKLLTLLPDCQSISLNFSESPGYTDRIPLFSRRLNEKFLDAVSDFWDEFLYNQEALPFFRHLTVTGGNTDKEVFNLKKLLDFIRESKRLDRPLQQLTLINYETFSVQEMTML